MKPSGALTMQETVMRWVSYDGNERDTPKGNCGSLEWWSGDGTVQLTELGGVGGKTRWDFGGDNDENWQVSNERSSMKETTC